MGIRIRGASEHNLQHIDLDLEDGLTVVTGISGSGKSSLVFDTLYHEARRRFLDLFSIGSPGIRLTPARVASVEGLGPAVAVGQNLLNRNPSSTVATASGLHPFLRLLYAHFGRRSCLQCGTELLIQSEDEMVHTLQELSKTAPCTIQIPLLNHVPGSHRTLLALLEEELTFEKRGDPEDEKEPERKTEHEAAVLMVDGQPWNHESLDPKKSHTIEITAGCLKAGAPAAEIRKTVRRASGFGALGITAVVGNMRHSLSSAPVCPRCGVWFGSIEPVHFHTLCSYCAGKGCDRCLHTGLYPEAAAVRWQGKDLPELLSLTVSEFHELIRSAKLPPPAARLKGEIERRSGVLHEVGLGYVSLDRSSPSLSRGESQRLRLAVILGNQLEDMLHVMDEPTIGQHPEDVRRLLPQLKKLKGPVVYVEHDRTAAAAADQAVDLGPGAGKRGGELLFHGIPEDLWRQESPTGRYFSLRESVSSPPRRHPPDRFLVIRGASHHNLEDLDCSFPLHRLTVVTGVSGSGKTTLVCHVLGESLRRGKPVNCRRIEGPMLKAVSVDQKPIGKNPRSNPATYTKLSDEIRDLFAGATGFSASHFSFNRPEGACETCGGIGALEVPMRYLPPVWIPCSDCEGRRFKEEVLSSKIKLGDRLFSIAGLYEQSIEDAKSLLSMAEASEAIRSRIHRIISAIVDVGLGYLSLAQPSPTLSGGEAQRVKLAKHLSSRSLSRSLLILDEPSTGLHPQDVSNLLMILDRLVRAGATVVVIEHNTDIIRAADWIIDLGPGAGPEGGSLLYSGSVEGVLRAKESATGAALIREQRELEGPAIIARRRDDGPIGRKAAGGERKNSGTLTADARTENPRTDAIRIKKARTHNLKSVNVSFPKKAITAVTGLSGSGKTSLVTDVLMATARRRFLESLSLYERQSVKEGPEADVEEVSGLGVAVALDERRGRYEQRATVGTATEIAHYLAVLFARLGKRRCPQCGKQLARMSSGINGWWKCRACGVQERLPAPRHFLPSNYAAACLSCHGVGSHQMPQPEKLIIHPEQPLCCGAMYSPGFFPKGYLCQPFNGGYYMVQALAKRYRFDPSVTPWDKMSKEAQKAFLFGDPKPLEVYYESRTGRSGVRRERFPGFYGWIRDWDVGGTYTKTEPCSGCHGSGLRPAYESVTLAGKTLHSLKQMDLNALAEALQHLSIPAGEAELSGRSVEKILRRLTYLRQVGLGYLHLDRPTATLSAGEIQRIKLAGLLGGELTSLTVLLDEPSRGLHPSEVQGLLNCMMELKKDGNTVIVVEHDPVVISGADHVIDMGPGAGTAGGRVVWQGPPASLPQATTPTADWLRGERNPRIHRDRRKAAGWMHLIGAWENNLKVKDAAFPLGTLIGVCGVSGSGKSTLIMDTLGRTLAPKKQTTSVAYEPMAPGRHDRLAGAPSRCIQVDQSKAGIHNPASYLKITQKLKNLYAESDEAQARGLNTQTVAPRCSACRGAGVLSLDMAFLPAVQTHCDACDGTGFAPEARAVRLRGYSLPELWAMTIDVVFSLWKQDRELGRLMGTAREVGLGYLVLGQHALSGGEAQRLKIAAELLRPTATPTLYLLDEPTVGQHLEDVSRLLGVLHRLVDLGHSVIVVEHQPMLLASCDWIIELGPAGGPGGGRIIATGTPEQVAGGATPTAPYLQEVLGEGS